MTYKHVFGMKSVSFEGDYEDSIRDTYLGGISYVSIGPTWAASSWSFNFWYSDQHDIQTAWMMATT